MSKKTIKKVATEANVVKKEEDKKVAVKELKVAEAKDNQPKKVEANVPEAKKTVVKKTEQKKITTKKALEKIAAKPEPKKISTAKTPEKIAVKAEPKKLETKKAAAVKSTVVQEMEKPEKKKTVAKKAEPKKEAVKKEAARPAKKTAKANDNVKLEKLQSLSLEECIAYMQAMNVQYEYEDYYTLLLDEADINVLEKNIIDGNNLKAMHVNYDEVGYDEDLVLVTLNKVADTMDIKAMDYKHIKQSINKALKFKFNKDGEVNAAQYLDEFKISEKLLMIGQRKNVVHTEDLTALIGANVAKFYQHFFAFAYEILPEWQYNDVKFYEDFAYAVLSQFADLYESDQLRVQMDVADLYIKHGDYQHGDEMYGYILRDNQIKDYIYYRYASIYKEIDFNKARSIAYSSLQYVDDRYMYYTAIMEIINN